MTKSRALIPGNTSINRDEDGTYIYYAKMAARNEAGENHSAAEALWLKAMRVAAKPINSNGQIGGLLCASSWRQSGASRHEEA